MAEQKLSMEQDFTISLFFAKSAKHWMGAWKGVGRTKGRDEYMGEEGPTQPEPRPKPRQGGCKGQSGHALFYTCTEDGIKYCLTLGTCKMN